MERIINSRERNRSGFTLVELSIVLVIIGLIISSVLVGQDLVRSAELRSTISQKEGFDAALGTFRGKYNGLAGDTAGLTNFGFICNGNGNGTLSTSTDLAAGSVATPGVTTGENTCFWSHLGSSGAAIIPGSYAAAAITSTVSVISANLPSAKSGNYWGVYTASGVNYYIIGVIGAASGVYATEASLTPLEARDLDTKIDDGNPGKGLVVAKGASATDADTAPDATALTGCVSAATASGTYTTANKTLACTLRLRMSL